jgi:hypothetical protein
MAFFKKVFSPSANKNDEAGAASTYRSFGRYTEVNKPASQVAYWTKAQDAFSQRNYIESFNDLLLYMYDPAIQNIQINRHASALDFEMVQGSKIIRGRADAEHFMAEARIARFDKLSVAFLRKLMHMNYTMQYTRFAIKDDLIYLKFDSNSMDASPHKVYFSLKELALKSDKMDDMLVGEFTSLHPIDYDHIIRVPDSEKEIKYKYLQLWIAETLNKISILDQDKLAGGISYMILALLFRIDFLLQPQGNFFDDIDKINSIYNAKDNRTTPERNRQMLEELRKLQEKNKEEIFKDLYEVKATFGYVPATTHKQLFEFILEGFKNIQWYHDNRHDGVVTAIYEWIIGYSVFYFGLFPATYDLLRLAYNILQPDFFREMGITVKLHDGSNQSINKAAVEKEIQKILKVHMKDYPKLSMMNQNISYKSLNEFLYTFLNEITYLNYSKA